jgi:hypothetical protein
LSTILDLRVIRAAPSFKNGPPLFEVQWRHEKTVLNRYS